MVRSIFLLSSLLLSLSLFGQSVSINIENIRNSDGQFQLAVFENEEQFKNETPTSMLYFDKEEVKDGFMDISLNLRPGTYGITVLDDEDKSKNMSFKMAIYPTEGIGFSNYELKGMRKPKFSSFSFTVDAKETKKVKVILKYF